MADKNNKIEKLEAELKSLTATLVKYGDMFSADGIVDSKEQEQLNQMQDVIQKIEKKLATLKNTSNLSASSETKSDMTEDEFIKVLDEMESIVTKHKEVLLAFNQDFNKNYNNIA